MVYRNATAPNGQAAKAWSVPVRLAGALLLAAVALFVSTAHAEHQTVTAVEANFAEQPSWTDEELAAAARIRAQRQPAVELRRTYVWGVNKYALDHATRVTGWEVANGWYFGRAKGEDSGIALVWQRKRNQQVSLSNDGLRFTRRF